MLDAVVPSLRDIWLEQRAGMASEMLKTSKVMAGSIVIPLPCSALLSLRGFRARSPGTSQLQHRCTTQFRTRAAPAATELEMHRDIQEILFTEEALQHRIAEMGRDLARDYADRQPLIIGTLNGAFIYMADLVRAIRPLPDGMQLDFLRASSYVGASTTSEEAVSLGLVSKISVTGRHVLVVEDIIDTGATLQEVCARLRAQGAASVHTVALLDKSARRTVPLQPDYKGFECPDQFVVGYGLDFNEIYRSLSYIGVLRPECYM